MTDGEGVYFNTIRWEPPARGDTPLPNPACRLAPDGGAKAPKVAELEVFAAAEFGDGEPPPRRWFVQNLIPEGEVTILPGDGGTGKSQLALQLGFASATATDWIGLFPEPGKVLAVSAEDKKGEIHRRLFKIASSKNRRLSEATDLLIVPLAGKDEVLPGPHSDGVIRPTPLFQALRAKLKAEHPKLLILDTRADLFDGDEIKRVQVRRFIGMLNLLCVEFDLSVLLLDHPSAEGIKSGTGKAGSTAWSNSVRSRL